MNGYLKDRLDDITFRFQPIMRRNGTMIACECLTRFNTRSSDEFDIEKFFMGLGADEKQSILEKQLEILDTHSELLMARDIKVSLNISEDLIQFLRTNVVRDVVKRNPYIVFELNEFSTCLVYKNHDLEKLFEVYDFWVDDFGRGYAGFETLGLYDFNIIKINKNMFWSLMRLPNGKSMIISIVNFLNSNGFNIIIEGVENRRHIIWLKDIPWYALQGFYWPEMSIKKIIDNKILSFPLY
ncbi:TPA: EAL domain-containing protein [Raoultella planticola]